VSAGFAITCWRRVGKLVIYPIERAANWCLTDAAQVALGWIAENQYPVSFGVDAEVSAEDAETYRSRVEVKLKANMPNDKVAIANMWNMMITGGWGDPETAWEDLGYGDADKMTQRLLDFMWFQKYRDQMIDVRGGESGAAEKLKHPGLPSQVTTAADVRGAAAGPGAGDAGRSADGAGARFGAVSADAGVRWRGGMPGGMPVWMPRAGVV